jgi:serine/threonine protein kinase
MALPLQSFSLGTGSPSPTMVERFAREIKALEVLASPNVLQLVDLASYDGRPVAILELAEESLYARLKREGRPSVGQALCWIQELADGLQDIHKAGYVHRDLSPKNCLFVGESERLCLSDLGAVRAFEEDTITLPGDHLGSLIYVSPQQAADPHRAAPSDDVFSLGQIAYELLTGLRPQGNPPPLSEVHPGFPEAVVAVIDRLRASDVSRRVIDGTEAADILAMSYQLWLNLAAGLLARGNPTDGLSALQSLVGSSQVGRMSSSARNRLRVEAYSVGRVPTGDLPDSVDLLLVLLANDLIPDDQAIRLRVLRWAAWQFRDDLEIGRLHAAGHRSWEDIQGARSVGWPRPALGSTETRRERVHRALRNFDLTIQAFHATANMLSDPDARHFYSESRWPSLKDLADPKVRHALISGEFYIAYETARERGAGAVAELAALLPSGWLGPLDDLQEDLIVAAVGRSNGTLDRFPGSELSGVDLEARFGRWLRTSCRCDPRTFAIDPNFLSATGAFPTRKPPRDNCPFTRLSNLGKGVAAPAKIDRFVEHFDLVQGLRYLTEVSPLAIQLASDQSRAK